MDIRVRPQDSIMDILSSSPSGPIRVYLERGVYREKLFINRDDVSLIGEDGVLILWDDNRHLLENGRIFSTGDSATVTIGSSSFYAENVIFKNSFDYYGMKRRIRDENRDDLFTQAVSVRILSTSLSSHFRKCAFRSYQDTLYIEGRSSLFENCTVEGAVDYVFGMGEALFKSSYFISLDSGIVIAPSTKIGDDAGFVFDSCVFSASDGVERNSVSLLRGWHPSGALNRSPKCIFINPVFHGAINKELFGNMKSRRPDGTEHLWVGREERFSVLNPVFLD